MEVADFSNTFQEVYPTVLVKTRECVYREMAQQLKTLDALPEDPGSVLSTISGSKTSVTTIPEDPTLSFGHHTMDITQM